MEKPSVHTDMELLPSTTRGGQFTVLKDLIYTLRVNRISPHPAYDNMEVSIKVNLWIQNDEPSSFQE